MKNISQSMVCACGVTLNFSHQSTGDVMTVQDFKVLIANTYDRY